MMCARQRFFTNTFLGDPDKLREIEEGVDVINEALKRLPDFSRENVDIVLEIQEDVVGDPVACYYMCDLQKEEIFWLTEVSVDLLFIYANVPVYDHVRQLKNSHRAHFWDHIQMFPHKRRVKKAQYSRLRSEIWWRSCDKVTSYSSCVPFNDEDLVRYTHLLAELHPEDDDKDVPAEVMATIARIQSLLAHADEQNLHGTKWARTANRSIFSPREHGCQSSWTFTICSWLLFLTPSIYLQRLDEIWLDHHVHCQKWRKFIDEIQSDWVASITPSAVILTANVGFLAIQSVDVGTPDRSVGQVVSYISTLLSIGNIIACTILARQHRPASHLWTEQAVSPLQQTRTRKVADCNHQVNYLATRARTRWQTERLAIVLAIPTAFFLWALIAFCAAIFWLCFRETSLGTRVAASATVLITAVLVLLVVMNGDWAAVESELVQDFPDRMAKLKASIPVREFREQTRRLTAPMRRFTADVRASAPIRMLTGDVKVPARVRRFTHRMRRPTDPVLTEL
ncbi:hypothetical protein C8Q77DRAFT_183164 [Trametes polyzona]|nr:hypothetical protein C8Q77DRAFT_183164 [Trametes polyzona]